MRTKILASVLVAVLAWTGGGVGSVRAGESLGDMPSTGEFVMLGVGVVLVITAIVVLAVNYNDDTAVAETAEAEEGGEARTAVLAPAFEPEAGQKLRIDPVLALRKDAVGAGLVFSF